MWRVSFSINGKNRYFGSFKTESEAEIFSEVKSKEIVNCLLPVNVSEYRDIPGYDGKYKISRSGEVLSIQGASLKKLKQDINQHGYCIVKLSKDNQKRKERIHRLVYQSFVGKIPDGMVIDHIDRNKLNNNADNLRLTTYSVNNINCDRVDKAKGFHKVKEKFKVTISVDGKSKSIGYFNTEEEASKAYNAAKQMYHNLSE